MDAIFMNSENSRTSKHHVLVLKLTDKLDLRRVQKTVALSNLSIYYMWKIEFLESLSYLMDHIQYQIFKIILNIF